MLLSFSVENFLSFREPVDFSAVASREVQHGERLAVFRDIRVLPTAAIYGGNGSGKSNFMFALRFLRDFVVEGTEADEVIDRRFFKLDPACGASPTKFLIEFVLADDDAYRYELHLSDLTVVFESLTEIRPASEKVVFLREGNTESPMWQWDYFNNRSKFTDEDRQFLQFVARGTRPNQPFLSEAVDRNVSFLKPIYDWFASNLVILDPNSALESLEAVLQMRNDLRRFANESLRHADTGIVELEGEEILLDNTSEIPMSVRDNIRKELKKEGSGLLFRSSLGHRFSIYLKDNEVLVSRLYTHHRSVHGEPVRFDFEEESEGTRRFVDLLPVFYDLQNSESAKVYIIDELDRSMHSLLTRSLLEGFLATCDAKSRGQLIFTTHEEQLLDQALLRRDEIWFLNKPEDGSSFLECLADYHGVRNDMDIRKAYLHGRFSGVPVLRKMPRIRDSRKLVSQ